LSFLDHRLIVSRLREYFTRKSAAALVDAAVCHLVLCQHDNGTWPPTPDFRKVTADVDPISLSMTFYACRALIDAGLLVPFAALGSPILAGIASRKDVASDRYGARKFVTSSHTFLQNPSTEVRPNLRHTAAALLTRYILGDSFAGEFSLSLARLVEDLNDPEVEKDRIGICFSTEVLVRVRVGGHSPEYQLYDEIVERNIAYLLAPSQRNADGLWNPHQYLGHGAIEDSALILFSMRSAVAKYPEPFRHIISILFQSRSQCGWEERPPPADANLGHYASVRASIWSFAVMAHLSTPSADDWNWYVSFLRDHFDLNGDRRAPLSVAETSCVLSTLAAGGFIRKEYSNSFIRLKERLQSIPEGKRELIAESAFEAGWRTLSRLTGTPFLRVTLLRFNVSLLNQVALRWSPMLTLIGFALAIVSLVVGILGLYPLWSR
jgi:hypothetical protein